MYLSNFFEDMYFPCLLTIYGLIGLVLYYWIYGNNNNNQMIKDFLHVENSHLFLDAQLQLQPIQLGEHAVCEP